MTAVVEQPMSVAPSPPRPSPQEWRCYRCLRYLARVEGDTFTRPNGDSGRLPAVIRCKCGERNVKV